MGVRMFDRFFPGRAAKAKFKTAIGRRILGNVQDGLPISPEDVRYVRDAIGETEAKWLRQMQVAKRAAVAIESQSVAGLLPAASAPSTSKSSPEITDDWLARFWDDAGLVSDETLQEVYARVLALEVTRPGKCSLRTLRALRYMDQRTAIRFARVARGSFRDGWIPNDPELLEMWGIEFHWLLDLDDAGLVDSTTGLEKTIMADTWDDAYGPWAFRIDRIHHPRGIPAYVLKESGRDLLRVADIDWKQEEFFTSLHWIQGLLPKAVISWSLLPDPKGDEIPPDLDWKPLVSGPSKRTRLPTPAP